ncbi:hypothetical protein [uncultured Aliiroseovarius sp.]|uniref:hypothetical protein n=1 Tax=uncultured Aliiroseovarius sp. TaxID=1658783 RepID=UPI002598F1EB|nr:hypothetical protein [uncultured Aliiroseovarius sp.]
MTATENQTCQRLKNRAAFVAVFADKMVVGGGMQFTNHTNGRISGLAHRHEPSRVYVKTFPNRITE